MYQLRKVKEIHGGHVQRGRDKREKTNHSLRATGATALFSAGVPERLIRDVTGHQSNAL